MSKKKKEGEIEMKVDRKTKRKEGVKKRGDINKIQYIFNEILMR